MVSPRHVRSRTQSISSDRPSTAGFGLVLPPLSVSPEATFIAPSAASQIITNDHDSHADAWYDQNGIEPARETAIVSGPALQLVNGFLDQLLFNFLQISRATSLTSLRPAVIEVLKPKLGKDAIANADEELGEYLGDADEGDYVQPQRGPNSPRDWDAELVWKRTRLRCMVYSSLGDMEEEDEDLYMAEENLEIGADEQISDVISPAVAIFLTSVIEYMGELTLTVAGQAAYHRVRSKIERELREGSRDPAETADRIVVTELDMERVALDRTLGRLWRGWKKRMRIPTTDMAGRPFSRGSPSQHRSEHASHDALGLTGTATGDYEREGLKQQDQHEEPIAEDVDPMDIPLPLGDHDVDEIEVPGLSHYSDEDDGDYELDEEDEPLAKRPKSFLAASSVISNGLPTPTTSVPDSPLFVQKKRPTSLPIRRVPQFYARARKMARDVMTPSETADGADNEDEEEAHEEKRDVNAAAPALADAPSLEKTEVNPDAVDVGDLDAADTVASDYEVSSLSSHYSDADEEARYEQAEIVTSSRVSVLSNHSDSDHGSAVSVQRSSSVRSARIIDVPAHSRGSSMDSVDGARPRSVSGTASSLARAAVLDDRLRSVSGESARATPTSAPGAVSPTRVSPQRLSPDRRKLSTNRASVISEGDEDGADQTSVANSQTKKAGSVGLTAASTSGTTPAAAVRAQSKVPPAAEAEYVSKPVEKRKDTRFVSKDSTREAVVAKERRDKHVSAIPAAAIASSAAVTAAATAVATAAATSSSGFATAPVDSAEAQRKKHPPVSLTTAPKAHSRTYDEVAPNVAPQPVKTPVSQTAGEADRFPPDLPRRSPGHSAARGSPKQLDSRGFVSTDRTSKYSDQFDQVVPPAVGQRPQHTSASSVSSGQSRRKPLRTSEDESSHSDYVARNFEELIQSNQTITYTLTPENMRDIDVRDCLCTPTDFPRILTRVNRRNDPWIALW